MTAKNFDEVRQAANKVTATTATAVDILRAAIIGSETEQVTLAPHELVTIWAALNPPKKAKRGEFNHAWIYKAAGVKDVHGYLNQAYCDGENMVSVDGHRMHWMPSDKPSGFYGKDGELLPDQDCGKFPDYRRVIPSRDERSKYTITMASLPVETIPWHPKRFADAYRLPNGAFVQKRYLDAAVNGLPEFCVYLSNSVGDSILVDLPDSAQAVIVATRK